MTSDVIPIIKAMNGRGDDSGVADELWRDLLYVKMQSKARVQNPASTNLRILSEFLACQGSKGRKPAPPLVGGFPTPRPGMAWSQ